jgi:hypothetical protein
MKKNFVFLVSFLFCYCTQLIFADDIWHMPKSYLVQKDKTVVDVFLTSSWEVSPFVHGQLTAINAKIQAKLSVEIFPLVGSLEGAVANLLPPSFCSDLQKHLFTQQGTPIEETYCSPNASSIELGRFFFLEGNLVAIEAQISTDSFSKYGDELWQVIRSIRWSSEALPTQSQAVPEGSQLYKSPDGFFSLIYPKTWKQEMAGKNLVLYIPNGPNIQVIPATDSLMGKDPQLAFEGFEESLHYSLKDFSLEGKDTLPVHGMSCPRIVYHFSLPTGTPEKAWAVLLNYPSHAYLLVCSAPVNEFNSATSTFLSVLDSFQVKL